MLRVFGILSCSLVVGFLLTQYSAAGIISEDPPAAAPAPVAGLMGPLGLIIAIAGYVCYKFFKK